MEFKKGKYYGIKEEGFELLKVRASSLKENGIIATGFDSQGGFNVDEMFLNSRNNELVYEIIGDEAKVLKTRIELKLRKKGFNDIALKEQL